MENSSVPLNSGFCTGNNLRTISDGGQDVQSELCRGINEIINQAQRLLVGVGDQLGSNREVQDAARLIKSHAEQAMEVVKNRLDVALLPLECSEAQSNATIGKDGQGGKSRLLVVDDNSVNRELLSRRLELQGYIALRAENGRVALEELRKGSIDLVLLDIMMPEIDGYQVLKTMKAEEILRDIPVMMISALGDLDSIVRCIEVGAEDYLSKPFNSTILLARVESCLEKKRLRDQVRATYQTLLRTQKQLAEALAKR